MKFHLSQEPNTQIFLLSTERLIDLYTSIIDFNTGLDIKSEICQDLHYETHRSLSVIEQREELPGLSVSIAGLGHSPIAPKAVLSMRE